VTTATPGSQGSLYLVVSDIESARKHLADRGAEVSEVFHRSPGRQQIVGLDPQRSSYASFASFSDPDGNAWLVQEVTARLPGRLETQVISFRSVAGLAKALRLAEAAHGAHEKQTGQKDANWPDWYAQYMVGEPTAVSL
jgi:hypothetical protein